MQTNKPELKYIEISHDHDAQDPRDDNAAFLTTVWHRPNRTVHLLNQDSFFPHEEDGSLHPDVAFSRPLYMLAHSGRALSLTPFNDPWDSGQLGFAFITHEALKRAGLTNMTEEEATQTLTSEIQLLNDWMEGNVYQVDLLDKTEDRVFTIGGFYGQEHAKESIYYYCAPDWLPEGDATRSLIQQALNSVDTKISINA